MNRKPILWAVNVLAVGFVVLVTQRNARRTIEQERGHVEIKERTANGYKEWYSRRIFLPTDPTDLIRRQEWYAAVFADPSKPPFALVFRNAGMPPDPWREDVRHPIAVVADGQRHEMKRFQALVSVDGNTIELVSVGGARSILAALVAASKAEIEFGGKRYAIDERGLANCRELLKRSTNAGKQN